MTPGWYYAQGDPPGTQRYWDGAQWIGEPVYEPAAPAVAPPAYPPSTYAHGAYAPATVAPSSFPTSLKTMAIILSVLKAIPLAFGLVVTVLLATWANDIDDTFFFDEGDLGGLLNAAVVFLLVFIAIGATLLGFQFVGAIKERPLMVAIPAILMSILDSLAAVSGWADTIGRSDFDNSSPGGAVLITAIAAVQIAVAVLALRANSS